MAVPPPPAPASDCRRDRRVDRLRAAAARVSPSEPSTLDGMDKTVLSQFLGQGKRPYDRPMTSVEVTFPRPGNYPYW
jgi:hypothetical protein